MTEDEAFDLFGQAIKALTTAEIRDLYYKSSEDIHPANISDAEYADIKAAIGFNPFDGDEWTYDVAVDAIIPKLRHVISIAVLLAPSDPDLLDKKLTPEEFADKIWQLAVDQVRKMPPDSAVECICDWGGDESPHFITKYSDGKIGDFAGVFGDECMTYYDVVKDALEDECRFKGCSTLRDYLNKYFSDIYITDDEIDENEND